MNTLTTAFELATQLKEATKSQPQLLEVPGADLDTLKADLATSGSDRIRFDRVADMMAEVAGEIKSCADTRSVGGHIRHALVVVAAAMPNYQLTAQSGLVEEWRTANAKIDILEEEKANLEGQIADLSSKIESMEDKIVIRARQAGSNEEILRLTNNSNPMRVNFSFDRTKGCLIELPTV